MKEKGIIILAIEETRIGREIKTAKRRTKEERARGIEKERTTRRVKT